MGSESLGKLLLRLSIPGIISMTAISLYNLVDTLWVARLGYQAVAALTVVMPFFILCIAIGVGTGVGINALASKNFGEKNFESANKVAGQSFFLSLLLGIIFLLITNLFPNQIMRLSGATPDIVETGASYLRVLGFGMPMLFFSIINRNVYQASGDAMRPMIFTLLAQLSNVILDPCFIFGWGIFPKMGVAGAALATVIGNCLSMTLALRYMLANKTAYRFKWHHLNPDLPTIRGIYRVGFPASLMQITESIVFALFNHVVAGFGSVALAAVGIAARIGDLAFMPIIGTEHGLLPIVGFSYGARMWKRLWASVRLASIAMAILMLILTIILEIFIPQIVSIFSKDQALIDIAVPGVRVFIITFTFVGPTVMFIATFQGLSKGKEAMFLSLARQCIFFIPALYILTALVGLPGVWISMPISDFMGFLISGLWIYREYRLQKKNGVWADSAEPSPTIDNPD